MAGVKNGELLQLAAGLFDVLLTVDRNLEYQQNFAGVELAVIVLHAPSNDVAVLRPLMSAVLAALAEAKPGRVNAYPAAICGTVIRGRGPAQRIESRPQLLRSGKARSAVTSRLNSRHARSMGYAPSALKPIRSQHESDKSERP